ncbi:MAG: isoleucine--tRNA ligase [Bacteroidota bacterium]|nr:isoleucine--tRNA ligase [Bacteroidota bacterium]
MYRTLKQVNWPEIETEVLKQWQDEQTFEQSVSSRDGKTPFVFYEGPPSANGMPGIHHVMARAIKDIFCRYKTLQGFQVNRKGGWDTHGLPIELQVEKRLGITKEDIGKKISVEEYNAECRKDVMLFKDKWDELTIKMGYWVDLDNPYITYENEYIETLWYLLKELYKKDYLYKGYTIQPFSPAAGTGLSSHELNQPGTYKDVTDTTIVAQFLALKDSNTLLNQIEGDVYLLAWTTTPWTLPSNTALTVGPKIDYVLVKTFNQYTFEPIQVILAKKLVQKQFGKKYIETSDVSLYETYNKDAKEIPFQIIAEYKGKELVGTRYEQLFKWTIPHENPEKAFVVIDGDFVTTEDGTGIVHTAPTFGADDARVAKQHGVPAMLILDSNNKAIPLVNHQGKFIMQVNNEFAGKFVKNEYYSEGQAPEKSVDVELAIWLKEQNRAFKVEKYVHTYPHCWRTDKPILYYPMESWFIKTTAIKSRMVELNKTINWKPQSTGEGRFGNWLENLVDWNLSRSRYWGTPLPIWRTEDGADGKVEEICIGSVEELKAEVLKANQILGLNQIINDENIDLHKPFVDALVLVSPSGKPMKRESDLIDVWFDSGAMPYAQWGLKNKADWSQSFPADFIAEGVDQTRGWFFTLHALAAMLFDSVAYKNVIANGLVLDKNGNKMSKRLGNAIDPFTTIDKYGADATRWYMITNSAPWDNLKFDLEGIAETQRKFFGTLYNTYSFFAIYANIDNYAIEPNNELNIENLSELDRWILSKLNTLIKEVSAFMNDYDPTPAARAIETFVCDDLSNWYVRLSRRRFWKGEMNDDKKAAYDVLYSCLNNVTQLMSPFAPFFSEWLYKSLNLNSQSVHLSDFPKHNNHIINAQLEDSMQIAQDLSSMVLSLRKKQNLKVRQPLQKIMIPVLDPAFKAQIEHIKDLVMSEVNVKSVEFLEADNDILVKTIKPNFKTLGPKIGAQMKDLANAIQNFSPQDITLLENNGKINLNLGAREFELLIADVEVLSKDIPGWLVSSYGRLTVALDITITEELKQEGLAREFINRLQNLRKDSGFDVVDRIKIGVKCNDEIKYAILHFKDYICTEILADEISFFENLPKQQEIEIEGQICLINLEKNG